jgi:hypothetical protein
MFKQTSIEPQQLMLCGCSVLHIAARPNLSGNGISFPARRHT